MIIPVPLGDKVHSFSPARPSVRVRPVRHHRGALHGAGLNMPYELC
jgi:hypothetical protein